jgi:inner membrane protein
MIENQQLTAITDFRPLRQGSAVSVALNDRGERRNCEGSPLGDDKTARARERALAGAGGGAPAQSKGRCTVPKVHMPSPIAHGIAGVLAGRLVDPSPGHKTNWIAVYAAAGMAADLDLLVGAHSGPSHGVGAAVIVGFAIWLILRRAQLRERGRLALAVTMAYASHTLLDWLGTDSSPPIGIMALWPFSHQYYESSWHVFMAISRRYWLPEFWRFNLLALGRELLILVPIAAIIFATRGASPRLRRPQRSN